MFSELTIKGLAGIDTSLKRLRPVARPFAAASAAHADQRPVTTGLIQFDVRAAVERGIDYLSLARAGMPMDGLIAILAEGGPQPMKPVFSMWQTGRFRRPQVGSSKHHYLHQAARSLSFGRLLLHQPLANRLEVLGYQL